MKKENIILTAEKLFSEIGFQKTTIRQIASAAKANSAMLHYYFGSKESLFHEVLSRKLEIYQQQVIKLKLDEQDFYTRLVTFSNFHLQQFLSDIQFLRLMISEAILKSTEYSALIVKGFLDMRLAAFKEILTDGIVAKDIIELDVEATSQLFYGFPILYLMRMDEKAPAFSVSVEGLKSVLNYYLICLRPNQKL
jgi:AcrR family transcriptional regulator